MPLYEYQCDACDRRFEVIQKFSDAPVDVCPTCGGAVKRLISSPAIQFKGTGWYVTDYARSGKDNGKSAAKSDSGPTSSSGESTSTPKTETKTEAKSESKSESKGDSA